MDSTRSLGDLPGRRSCTEEAQSALAPRRKLGLAPGQLAARGAAPAVSQYETIDSDAIFGVRGASLTSFVASDRPSFRNRRARPRRCNYSENLKSSSPAISKRLKTFGFASTRPESRGGRLPHRCFLAWCTQEYLRERPGRVRSCSSSPARLTSGGPARGLHAPPGPNGPLQGRHVPPALLPPHRPLTYPACRFLLSPSAHKESAVESDPLGDLGAAA